MKSFTPSVKKLLKRALPKLRSSKPKTTPLAVETARPVISEPTLIEKPSCAQKYAAAVLDATPLPVLPTQAFGADFDCESVTALAYSASVASLASWTPIEHEVAVLPSTFQPRPSRLRPVSIFRTLKPAKSLRRSKHIENLAAVVTNQIVVPAAQGECKDPVLYTGKPSPNVSDAIVAKNTPLVEIENTIVTGAKRHPIVEVSDKENAPITVQETTVAGAIAMSSMKKCRCSGYRKATPVADNTRTMLCVARCGRMDTIKRAPTGRQPKTILPETTTPEAVQIVHDIKKEDAPPEVRPQAAKNILDTLKTCACVAYLNATPVAKDVREMKCAAHCGHAAKNPKLVVRPPSIDRKSLNPVPASTPVAAINSRKRQAEDPCRSSVQSFVFPRPPTFIPSAPVGSKTYTSPFIKVTPPADEGNVAVPPAVQGLAPDNGQIVSPVPTSRKATVDPELVDLFEYNFTVRFEDEVVSRFREEISAWSDDSSDLRVETGMFGALFKSIKAFLAIE